MSSKLFNHTTKDGGVTLQIRKVSPLVATEIRKKFPAPRPPMTKVDYGDGNFEMEPNADHPSHKMALEDYQLMLEEKVRRAYLKLGCVSVPDMELVGNTRAALLEIGIDLSAESDEFVFINYVAVASSDDYNDLIQAIINRSVPAEADIKAASDTFQPNVQG